MGSGHKERVGGHELETLVEVSKKMSRKRSRQYSVLAVILVAMATFVLFLAYLVFTVVPPGAAVTSIRFPSDPKERAVALLAKYPLIDGHNDLALQLRTLFESQLDRIDLAKNTSGQYGVMWNTDIPRLRAGQVGAQFWSAYMTCATQYNDATRTFLDQIDIIKSFVQKYPDVFKFALSVADIEDALKTNQIASLIGIESGHAIDSSLGTLRQMYALGVRYMTLTHYCNTPWAHSSYDNGTEGLNDFGRKVVREMNRLGMMVDISHVNNYTMMDVLNTTLAPVIFSHSSAYALCNNSRNVPDNVLERLKDNGGIVMATFCSDFVNCSSPNGASLKDVADHIDHLKLVAGSDHVGIGSDFDGSYLVPHGLEDVSKYPDLFAELIRRGYSDSDIAKISRQNFLRVFEAVEKVRDNLKAKLPDNTIIEPQPNKTCRKDF